ncbi:MULTISPECIES: PTS IIA-like nitrogen regulatory protein PtsN [unclassified Neptuniibacter]|jgi:PTS system nitrogen regulatory IIA component|uniref:PTS IIA-like nitrogen regulatory protein PtsN n=1 Tax=unclassified Neptuniibacter TaxID=2630693 RepID=UPI0025FEF8E3|nr:MULTISPECIES: PTS IIA-like nitrogen regulatory protein PtsN [unclassified Neptuniibacter]|tara:strand:- start:21286 stop:21741 length:456 start_codon:yes stop_codon:yes gene_type:complete
MLLHELLTPSSILCGLEGGSKKRILESAAEIISEQNPDMDSSCIFNGLLSREKLGSTGIGDGIAIPHCRLSECSDAKGYLVRLNSPIDFDAVDSQSVDLLFILIVPEDATSEHLQTLASIAELFSQETVRDTIRKAHDNHSIYNAILKLGS